MSNCSCSGLIQNEITHLLRILQSLQSLEELQHAPVYRQQYLLLIIESVIIINTIKLYTIELTSYCTVD